MGSLRGGDSRRRTPGRDRRRPQAGTRPRTQATCGATVVNDARPPPPETQKSPDDRHLAKSVMEPLEDVECHNEPPSDDRFGFKQSADRLASVLPCASQFLPEVRITPRWLTPRIPLFEHFECFIVV